MVMLQGMTKERVSARKSALAVWLREGLINLGPTFSKLPASASYTPALLSTFKPEFHPLRVSIIQVIHLDCIDIGKFRSRKYAQTACTLVSGV